MTALVLTRPLSQELTELIGRLSMAEVLCTGLTPDETRDLREWLQAARAKHHAELRQARAGRPGEIIPLPGRLCEDVKPCDSADMT